MLGATAAPEGPRNVWVKLSGLMGAQGGSVGGSGTSDWRAAQQESVGYCVKNYPNDRRAPRPLP